MRNEPRHVTGLILAFGVLVLFTLGADEAPSDQPSAKGGGAVADGTATAEQVLEQLKQKRKARPSVAPTQKPIVEAGASDIPGRGNRIDIDPRVLGTAPGMPQPKLRREGEFIPLRRGRIIRTPSASQVMFVFEADAKTAPEPPMILLPCQTLESMERLVIERGDQVVFLLSGQVFTYRGANYVLPSVMKLAIDKGNLRK